MQTKLQHLNFLTFFILSVIWPLFKVFVHILFLNFELQHNLRIRSQRWELFVDGPTIWDPMLLEAGLPPSLGHRDRAISPEPSSPGPIPDAPWLLMDPLLSPRRRRLRTRVLVAAVYGYLLFQPLLVARWGPGCAIASWHGCHGGRPGGACSVALSLLLCFLPVVNSICLKWWMKTLWSGMFGAWIPEHVVTWYVSWSHKRTLADFAAGN